MNGPERQTGPGQGERDKRRSGRRKKIILWSAVVFSVFALLIAAKPAYHWVKARRAAQFAAAADQLAAAGKASEAAYRYRAALQLDPLGYPGLRGAAQLASKLGRPEAIDLWEQVIKLREATPADRQQYAAELVTVGRLKIAETVISQLLKSDPNAKTLELASRYERVMGDRAKAIEFARLAVKNAPNDGLVRFRLAEVLAESTDPDQRAEARKILWELSGQESPYRQAVVEALGRAPELSKDERTRVLQMLEPLASTHIKDALLAADLRVQLNPENERPIYDETVARWSQAQDSNLIDLARWLNFHQQPERVLILVPIERALRDNQLLLARLDALASLQRWNDIDDLLNDPKLTFDPSVLESFRARTAQERNENLDAEVHWNHALSFAAADPLKLRFLANFAEQSGAAQIALRAYDQLAKYPEHATFAQLGIQHLSDAAGDVSVQRAAAEKIASRVPEDPNAAAQLAYLNLLAGTNVEANTATAKQLVAKYPNRLSFRVTAALGYLRRHDPGLALAQFKGPPDAPPIEWGKTPPSWRAVYAAALLANEENSQAEEIIKTIPMDKLRPEERALITRKEKEGG